MRMNRITIVAVTFVLAAGPPELIQSVSGQSSPVTRYTTSPGGASSPQNIFFPETGNVRAPAAIPGRVEPFILVGTAVSDTKRMALIRWSGLGTTRWVRERDILESFQIVQISPGGLRLRREEQTLNLSVGQSSTVLGLEQMLTETVFELVGLCQGPEVRFALLRGLSARGVRQVQVGQRLGTSTVDQILGDRIVVLGRRKEEQILIGERFNIEGQEQ